MSTTPPNDLTNRFTYHPPQPGQPASYELIRDTAHLLALIVTALTTPSREQSLALTHCEEVSIWANASIAREGAPVVDPATAVHLALTELATAKPSSVLVAALVREQ